MAARMVQRGVNLPVYRILSRVNSPKTFYRYCSQEVDSSNDKLQTVAQGSIVPIPSPIQLNWTNNIVVFDLETTGLHPNSDITQISAIQNDQVFNRYVLPKKKISTGASEVTGLTKVNNRLLLYGQPVECLTIDEAILKFIDFLRQLNKPILIGHNSRKFDVPVLYNSLSTLGLADEFKTVVHGFADTLLIARKAYPKFKQGYSQKNLVQMLLEKTYDAHNSLEDVKILKELFFEKLVNFKEKTYVFPLNFSELQASYKPIIFHKLSGMTQETANQLACYGVHLEHIRLAHKQDKTNGIKLLLQKEEKTLIEMKTIMQLKKYFYKQFESFRDKQKKRIQQAKKSFVVHYTSYVFESEEILNICEKFGKVSYADHINSNQYIGKDKFLLLEYESEESFRNLWKYMSKREVGHQRFWSLTKPNNLTFCHYRVASRSRLMFANTDLPHKCNSLEEFHKQKSMTETDIRCCYLACVAVEDEIQTVRVFPYGSCVNGFGTKGFDVDMFAVEKVTRHSKKNTQNKKDLDKLRITGYPVLLQSISEKLRRTIPGIRDCQFIPFASVPIFKFHFWIFGFDCDVSVEQMDAITMSELIYYCGEIDPRVKPLVTAVKQWIKCTEKFQNTSNFIFLMTVIYFLQTRPSPILPPLKLILDALGEPDKLNVILSGAAMESSKNTETLDELLREYFRYYHEFDFKQVVSVSEGRITELDPLDYNTFTFSKNNMRFINPILLSHNMGRNVSKPKILQLKQEIKYALNLCEDERKNDSFINELLSKKQYNNRTPVDGNFFRHSPEKSGENRQVKRDTFSGFDKTNLSRRGHKYSHIDRELQKKKFISDSEENIDKPRTIVNKGISEKWMQNNTTKQRSNSQAQDNESYDHEQNFYGQFGETNHSSRGHTSNNVGRKLQKKKFISDSEENIDKPQTRSLPDLLLKALIDNGNDHVNKENSEKLVQNNTTKQRSNSQAQDNKSYDHEQNFYGQFGETNHSRRGHTSNNVGRKLQKKKFISDSEENIDKPQTRSLPDLLLKALIDNGNDHVNKENSEKLVQNNNTKQRSNSQLQDNKSYDREQNFYGQFGDGHSNGPEEKRDTNVSPSEGDFMDPLKKLDTSSHMQNRNSNDSVENQNTDGHNEDQNIDKPQTIILSDRILKVLLDNGNDHVNKGNSEKLMQNNTMKQRSNSQAQDNESYDHEQDTYGQCGETNHSRRGHTYSHNSRKLQNEKFISDFEENIDKPQTIFLPDLISKRQRSNSQAQDNKFYDCEQNYYGQFGDGHSNGPENQNTDGHNEDRKFNDPVYHKDTTTHVQNRNFNVHIGRTNDPIRDYIMIDPIENPNEYVLQEIRKRDAISKLQQFKGGLRTNISDENVGYSEPAYYTSSDNNLVTKSYQDSEAGNFGPKNSFILETKEEHEFLETIVDGEDNQKSSLTNLRSEDINERNENSYKVTSNLELQKRYIPAKTEHKTIESIKNEVTRILLSGLDELDKKGKV